MSETRVVPAEPWHVPALAPRLRAADVQEIKAASGLEPDLAMALSCEASSACWTLLHKGNPEVIFGVAPWAFVPDLGQPWLLSADVQPAWRGYFARHSRHYVAQMLERYEKLANYTDARHTESHRWLLWCGFDFLRIEPEYGVERVPFILFGRTSRV